MTDGVAKPKHEKDERGWGLVFVLLWLLVRGVFAVGFLALHIRTLYLENGAYRNLEIGFSGLAWILNLLQVVGAIGLFRWHRWGLWMLVFVLLVNAGLDWATGSILSLLQNITLCGGLLFFMHDKMDNLE